jgi:tetratricopeptide (TPR) repeat protein
MSSTCRTTSRAVVEEVQLRISPEEKIRLTASRPVSPDAYEDYLRGRYYLQKWTSEGSARAFEFFQKATVEDPNYAPAYAGLAKTELRRPFLEPLPPREAWPAAAQAARKALELDESLAEAHGVLAAIKFRFDWDVAGADAEWKRALELDPNDVDTDVHWGHSVFLRTSNRYQEAIDEAKRARELDPVVPDRRAGLGEAYLIARKYDLAIEELRQVVARYPEGTLGYHFLGVAYEQKGLRSEAISALEQSVKLSRDPLYLAALAHAYAVFGRRQDAEKILAELQQSAKREYVSPYTIAVVWIGLGNKEQALAWLEKAYVDRSFHLVTINSWPWFDPLRSEPRFQNLVRRIGLDPDRAIPR